MQPVKLDERLYKKATRRAAEAGFSSVDEYVADVVSHDLVEENGDETPNLDHLFTPERLALIDEAAAEIKAGNCFTAGISTPSEPIVAREGKLAFVRT